MANRTEGILNNLCADSVIILDEMKTALGITADTTVSKINLTGEQYSALQMIEARLGNTDEATKTVKDLKVGKNAKATVEACISGFDNLTTKAGTQPSV